MKPVDILIAISVAVIWGMGFVIAKAGMAHFSPILLMALRFTLTAACLLCFFRPPPGILKQLFWISLISAALQYSLTFNGVRGIDASTAALLVQLEVPFGLIMAWLVFGDRIRPLQALGILVSFGGAMLIIGEPKLAGDLIYAFMVIGGAFTWAVGQIMIKKLGIVAILAVGLALGVGSGVAYAALVLLARHYSLRVAVLPLIFVQNLVIAVALLPLGVRLGLPDNATLGTLALLGVVHATVGGVLYLVGIRRVRAQVAAILGYLEPLGAVLLAAWFLGEQPGGLVLGGGVLILSAGALVVWDENRECNRIDSPPEPG